MFKLFSKVKKKVHFLHIGKTGGSAIKFALKDYLTTENYSVIFHGHQKTLQDIPAGEKIIFFLRDPVSRFISGFYSRQRKGRPRYYIEWRAGEKEVFESFKTPNQLACSLADKNAGTHSLAVKAMKNIHHFKRYNFWYVDCKYFQSRIGDILYIGFQETLNEDFAELKGILGIPESVSLPRDDIAAHKNPVELDKSIDERGVAALQDWYSEDIQFIALCRQIMSDKASSFRKCFFFYN